MSDPAKKDSRRGSTTSDREIAFAVRTGQRVTFNPLVGEPVTGYVGGMDDFHWKVATIEDGNVVVVLVHKTAATVKVHPKPTYNDDEHRHDLEQIVAPFRDYVMRTFFQNGACVTSASTREVKSA